MTQISVIIPTCDRPSEFVCTAIRSVLAQSLTPLEVIVVDNGTHNADPASLPQGVTLYRLPPRVGPSRARNFGAAMAKGTHLAFLDDDDWWDTNYLREATAVLQAVRTRCVYGRLDIHRNGNLELYKSLDPDNLQISVLLHRNPGTYGSNLLIEKTLFWRAGGFNETLRTSEDKALAIELMLFDERISASPMAIAVLRDHQGSRLSTNIIGRLRFVRLYRHNLSYMEYLAIGFRILRRDLKRQFKHNLRIQTR
ncbi:glycosyltransferase family 2 protein [Roseovarius sp. D22-M7]|uniref:glycosyltransferase family 2 protein n=1 Tax=Roseovarius sp. D22-M7 TaxID=3127116 RepID=UPI00300FA7B0